MKAKPIAGLCAVLILGIGCGKIGEVIKQVVSPPEVQLNNFLIKSIDNQRMNFMLELRVKNPNPVGVTFSGMDYQIDLAAKPLLTGRNADKLKLAASGESRVTVPVSAAYADVLAVYDALGNLDQDRVPFRVSGKTYINTPIGDFPLPFNLEGDLPVVRPAKINDVALKLDRLSFSGATLNLKLKIFNPNSFSLGIASANYSLVMDGNDFAAGSIGQSEIPAKSTGSISLPVSLSFSGMQSAAYSLLMKGSAEYQFLLNANYRIMDMPIAQEASKAGKIKIAR